MKGYMGYEPIDMKCPEQANPQRQEADQWLPGTGVAREWGVTANEYAVSFEAKETVLELDSGDSCATL